MYLQMKITSALACLNIVLLLLIIWLSSKSYKKMKAEYTLFVIIFAGLFLLQYLLGAYFYFTNMEFYLPEVSNHMLVLTSIQTIAFGHLLWMEWQ